MAASQEQLGSGIPEPTFSISRHGTKIHRVAWLPDDRLVTDSHDNTVRIWNLTSGTQEGTSMVHQRVIEDIVTTKDGRIIVHTYDDDKLAVWSADTQELMNGSWSEEHYGSVWGIVLSKDEELLATCHNKLIVFWDMVWPMQVRRSIHIDFLGFIGIDNTYPPCFSPDGKRLAYRFMRTPGQWVLVVLDVESGKLLLGPLEVEGDLCDVVWTLDGARLYAGCLDGKIRCLDSRTGETVGEPLTSHKDHCVVKLCLSPDGEWLASAAGKTPIQLWNLNVKASNLVGEPLYHLSHRCGAIQVAFSHSGEFIACVGLVGNISVWRVPWWDDDRQKAPDLLLDLSAVVSPDSGLSTIPREADLAFLDVSEPHRLRRSRVNPSDDTPRMQSSARSWRWWKKIPRLVFDRSNPIYMGLGPPRVYVASRDDIHSSPRLPAQHTNDTVIAESPSGETSDESTTDSTPDDLEVGGIGCCGLLSRRRTRAIPEQRAVSVAQSAPTSRTLDSSIPPCMSSSPTQDILELPAVIRWP